MAAPEVGGIYALGHGLVKSSLFLIAGSLPSRNLKELQHKPIDRRLWMALAIASLSISGFPLFVGFGAKVLTLKHLLPWQTIAMNVAAVGTAISFAQLIFLPRGGQTQTKPGFWPAVLLLLGGLIVANAVYWEAYTSANLLKAIATIGVGWLVYFVVVRRTVLNLPRLLEQFEHLVGFMGLISILLFWMALA
jgi:multicomponent Na+:H+ antiporter subunit D